MELYGRGVEVNTTLAAVVRRCCSRGDSDRFERAEDDVSLKRDGASMKRLARAAASEGVRNGGSCTLGAEVTTPLLRDITARLRRTASTQSLMPLERVIDALHRCTSWYRPRAGWGFRGFNYDYT